MLKIEEMLLSIEKPARYVGGEVNSIVKPDTEARMALCFPDVYEIGMSHLGLKILYSLINAEPDLAAERCFAPWPDMADAMRTHGLPLTTLETQRPLRDCDIVGMSLQYELSATTILEMLDLAGIPLRSSGRTASDPIILGGGPCAFNPEPLADFFDAFLIGDGEEVATVILRRVAAARKKARSRKDILQEIATIAGVYVPSQVSLQEGLFTTVVEKIIPKCTLHQLDAFPFPAQTVVPCIPVTHDRAAIEIMRGCPQRCRFCQAGVIYRPTRFRDPNSVIDSALKSIASTGYDEVGLCSLSSGDYPYLEAVSTVLMEQLGGKKTSLSLSSLRASALSENLSFQVSRGKRTGFTIAPEAGSQRLRDVIAKNITEPMIMDGCREAFEAGWSNLKLYFMIGLPTETMEDVEAIVELTRKIVRPFPGKGVTVSVSSFVPKPHTPFQWAAQDSPDLLHEKQELLREKLRRVKGTRFKYHQIEMSLLEALIARGDRRIGNVIEEAWRLGQRFDGWTEQFKADRWKEAIQRAGINPNLYTGAIPLDEPLPWDHIGTVLTKEELKREWGKAHSGIPTLSCLDVNCAECAACATREGGALRFNRLPIEPLPAPSTQARLGPHIYRGIFQKAGPAAFFSHLDMGHALRMAFRRSGLRLAFTEGFTPLPKVSYGPPLPVGVEGFHEMIDFGLAEEVDPQKALSSINTQMPEGMRFLRITGIPGLKSHISRDISAAVYETEDPCCEFTETGGSALHERGALWASRSVSGRLYMLVHPEAKITAVFKAASGQERSRSAFRRTAIVLQGEDWNQFLPPPRASTES